MAGPASFEQITESDFSSLLQALSDTPKGRRFLEEYRRRHRAEEAVQLLESLKRIEATISSIRDQLPPGWLAEELLSIAMTLEIALDGAAADPDGDDVARRFALIGRARVELASLAGGLTEASSPAAQDGVEPARHAIELTADQSAFFQQLGLGDHEGAAER